MDELTIGTAVQNLKTGTIAEVVDISANGIIWLSNGATWPEESFFMHWAIVGEVQDAQPAA